MSDVRPFRALRKEAGKAVRDPWESYYLIELSRDGKSRTGFVGVTAVTDFEAGIRLEDEKKLSTSLLSEEDQPGSQTVPVIMEHRRSFLLEKLIPDIKVCNTIYDFTNESGIRQKIWRVDFPPLTRLITECFRGLEDVCVTGGIELAAAAVRDAVDKREHIEFAETPKDEPLTTESWKKQTDVKRDVHGKRVESEYVLSVLFPKEEPACRNTMQLEVDSGRFMKDLLIHEL